MDKVLEKRDLPKLTQADIKTLKCPECLAEIEPVIRHPPTKKSAGPEGSLVNLPLGKDEYTPALASAKKRKKKETPNSLIKTHGPVVPMNITQNLRHGSSKSNSVTERSYASNACCLNIQNQSR